MSKQVNDFVSKIQANDDSTPAEKQSYNTEWATIKASLPENERVAAESKVRTVLPA